MSRKFSKRERSIFLICILMLIGYIVKISIIDSIESQKEAIDSQIASLQLELRKANKFIIDSNDIILKYNELTDKLKQSKSAQQILSSTLSSIETVSKEFKLNISDLKPNEVRSTKYINIFSVSMTINSPFVEVLHFIHKLQSEQYSFEVDSVNFEKSLRLDDDSIRTTLVLSKYYIK